jgi:tetratricopeptide (TPR) repeat protein
VGRFFPQEKANNRLTASRHFPIVVFIGFPRAIGYPDSNVSLLIPFHVIGVAVLGVATAFTPAPAFAQSADEAWQDYLTQAMYASGAKDFVKSEDLFAKALHEAQRFGPNDARIGTTLNSLGLVYRTEKKLAEADSAFRRALPILETTFGSDSLERANVDFNIASVAMDLGKWQEALTYLKRCLRTYQERIGTNSLKTSDALCLQGMAYLNLKEYKEAEPVLKRCADIRETDGGMENAGLGEALHNLATTYQRMGKNTEAEPMFRLAAKIREKALGITSPQLADSLEAHAALLKEMGRQAEADRDNALAAAIRRSEKKAR